jgi:hypothetical protein
MTRSPWCVGTPWQEMLGLVDRSAPWDFLIYSTKDVEGVVRLAWDKASAVAYLMGDHTIMEWRHRHEPAVLLYAPLHTVIWSQPGGEAFLSIDKPSDQFTGSAMPMSSCWGANSTRSWEHCLTTSTCTSHR